MRLRLPRLPKIEKKTLSQFWRVTIPFFRSEAKGKARGYLLLLTLLLFSVSGVNILMSYAARDFMSALSERQEHEFIHSLLLYLGTFALAIPIAVFYRYTEERLGLIWRQWLTQHLIRKYFNKRSYYQLRTYANIDNPDQRITEDVKNFTTTTLSFLLIILNSTITLFAFIGVLYSISGLLVAVLFGYAVAGTLFSILIGRRLVKLNFRQYKREATLRYGLIRVRDNAESIAFYRGEPREVVDLYRKLRGVLKNNKFIIGWNRNLAFFTTGYNYIALILPTIIVAPLYLRHQVGFGVITQAGGAFAQVLAAVSLIVTQFERLSQFTASVKRLGEFWDAVQGAPSFEEEDAGQVKIEEEERLSLKEVTVFTPRKERALIKNLSLQLRKAQGLLIMGASGSGKSSLLRTIAGLWNGGEGTIRRPNLRDMIFLPQRPYMISGTLRAQLTYPKKRHAGSDAELRKVIERVNLPELLDRVSGNLDKELDWPNILSLGEQQRLSFARILVANPAMVFLDEATSALDEENEAHLYGILKEMGLSYISVGHRSTLQAFHDELLTVQKEGEWSLNHLEHMKEKAI